MLPFFDFYAHKPLWRRNGNLILYLVFLTLEFELFGYHERGMIELQKSLFVHARIHGRDNKIRGVQPGLHGTNTAFFGRRLHFQSFRHAVVKSEIHAVHQIGQIVDEIFVHRTVGGFQTQKILVPSFQRFQFCIKIFVLSLKYISAYVQTTKD